MKWVILKKIKSFFFSEFFSINVYSALFGIGFTEKNLFWPKYLFSGYSKWWQIKQNATSLNRDVLSNFSWMKNANHMKYMGDYVMHTEKHILVKNVYKWAKNWFAKSSLIQKDSPWSRNTVW